MTAALTPALALAYLHELSADIRAAIVLDSHGNALAGPPALAASARALLAEGPLLSAATGRGGVFAARDDRHGVLVATGPLALPGLTLHDLATVLAALGGGVSNALAAPASAAAAEAVLNAL
jgi:hypothetical protein